MRKLRDDFGAVAAIVGLLLLTLITLTLAGVFNVLTDGQSAFLGTLAGASIGFMGLLAGALFNADLSRRMVLEDEEKRARACLLMLHARVRSFVVSIGLLGRMIEETKQVTVDNIDSFEQAARSLRPEEFPDLRLIDADVLSEFHDLSSHIEGTRFSSVAPIKLCSVLDGIYHVNADFLKGLVQMLGDNCDDAISLRRQISKLRSKTDLGPESYAKFELSELRVVTP